MSLNLIKPKNETEELLLSNTKFCELRIHQTHTKAQEILEFKLTSTRENFSFELSLELGLDSKWMFGF